MIQSVLFLAWNNQRIIIMSITLILTFIALFISAALGLRYSQLPKNIWLLFLAQPLAMCAAPMIVLAGGLVGAKMAPSPELATLPLTLMILGTATAVVPASMLMKQIGRKRGTIIGLTIGIIGALLETWATISSSFILLNIGATLSGFTMAFVAQLRFAALESVGDPTLNPKAISTLMISGLFAAILGPEIAVNAAYAIESPHGFAGSFLSLSILFVVAIIIISQLDPIKPIEHDVVADTRELSEIVKQPLFIIAIFSSIIGYSVMSYVMTATPLSMHENHGYDLDSIKWVVQSHIIAMYLPSLFSAALVKRFGINKLMTIGSIFYVIVVLVAMSGYSIMHYWWSMVMLGIGWNFLFTSGTLILPETYHVNERFKVQAVNDFGVFFVQALASLSAGIILFSSGWSTLISVTIPVILLMFILTFWFYRINKRVEL